MVVLWRFLVLLMLPVLASALSSDAQAAPAGCREIEARLSALQPRVVRPEGRYGRAAEAQRREIAKTQAMLRRSGCGFMGTGSAQCARLRDALGRMEANLSKLERRTGGGEERGVERERVRLERALERRGCRDEAPRRPKVVVDRNAFEPLRSNGGLGQVPDRDADRRGAPRVRTLRQIEEARRETPVPGILGSYRTLCVRLCDGYYFPMSFTASELDFAAEQARCEAACPGSQMRLYARRAGTDGDDGEAMTSVTGEPYAGLPTAFRFREPGFRRPAGCACGLPPTEAKGFSVVAGEPPATSDDRGAAPVPSPRPDPAAAPASLTHNEGDAQPDRSTELRGTREPAGGEDRKVRVVGPEFLPDPKEALDLRAPAPAPDP